MTRIVLLSSDLCTHTVAIIHSQQQQQQPQYAIHVLMTIRTVLELSVDLDSHPISRSFGTLGPELSPASSLHGCLCGLLKLCGKRSVKCLAQGRARCGWLVLLMFLIVTFVSGVSKDSDSEEDPSGVWLQVSWLRDNPSIYSLHNHFPPPTPGTNENI